MRSYKYKLTLEPTGETPAHEKLELEFDNHDEIFGIIERVKAKNTVGDSDQSTQFAIGIKMFSEVMIKNRENPLFAEFAPAFRDFMKKLKQTPAINV